MHSGAPYGIPSEKEFDVQGLQASFHVKPPDGRSDC